MSTTIFNTLRDPFAGVRARVGNLRAKRNPGGAVGERHKEAEDEIVKLTVAINQTREELFRLNTELKLEALQKYQGSRLKSWKRIPVDQRKFHTPEYRDKLQAKFDQLTQWRTEVKAQERDLRQLVKATTLTHALSEIQKQLLSIAESVRSGKAKSAHFFLQEGKGYVDLYVRGEGQKEGQLYRISNDGNVQRASAKHLDAFLMRKDTNAYTADLSAKDGILYYVMPGLLKETFRTAQARVPSLEELETLYQKAERTNQAAGGASSQASQNQMAQMLSQQGSTNYQSSLGSDTYEAAQAAPA